MKKTLFAITAIIYCCITLSFSVSNNTTSAPTPLRPFSQSLQPVNIYCGIGGDATPSLIYFRVYVNNELQIDWSSYVLGQAIANAGDTVRIEISTTPPDGGPNVTVQDSNGIIFSQNDPAINFTTFSFVAQAGQQYLVNCFV